jgi:phage gp16-like protein
MSISIDGAAAMRRRELAAIHVAAKQIGLARDTYVSMLRRVTGLESAADLDHAQRQRVIEELRRLGARPAERARKAAVVRETLTSKPRSPAPDVAAMVRKIGALLASAERPWAYAHGLARKMFHVTRVEWLRADQMHRLIAALEYDRRRREAKSAAP